MIEIIKGLPNNVVGFVATGRVTSTDCYEVLVPALMRTRKRHDKLRLYYQLECRFPGAAWEDLDIEPLSLQRWERVAVITDVSWIHHTVKALRFLIPGDVKVFPTVKAGEGRDWLIAA
jgi:hypothetical protein